MTTIGKQTFVLVHGAWYGAWAWHKVAPGLREMGHTITTPTLTGLGERKRCGNDTATLTTHIDDIVDHIMLEGLQEVTLVGWSYGGMVITGVLARIPEKIKSVIYLDAYVPGDGKTLVDYTLPLVNALFEEYKQNDQAIPPMPWEFFGVDNQEVIDFVSPRQVSHPWRTFYEPATVLPWPSGIPISYIWCTRSMFLKDMMEGMKQDARVRLELLDGNHLCMLTAPDETIEILMKLAQ